MMEHAARQSACVMFNRLTVTHVENSSGIFIGTNQAIGWSSVSKSNQGFGSASDCRLADAVFVVQDPDVLDTYARQKGGWTGTAEENVRQYCEISFQTLNNLSVSNGSAIDIGENRQNGWSGAHKSNYGAGKLYGGNRLGRVANIVMDDDASDTTIRVDKRFGEGGTG